MKALGIFLVGALAVAGGIAAATFITKKKLEKENEDNYYDDWDSDDIDDDWDFDFDEDMDVEDEPSLAKAVADAVPESSAAAGDTESGDAEASVFENNDVFSEETNEDPDEEL